MASKAIFLDRDGTLVKDPGYLNDPSQLKLLNGVGNGLVRLKKMGYKLVIVTNQSGVARGILTEKTLERIHEKLEQILSKEGAYIDGIYYCPYFEDGVIEKYRKKSELRKPEPGMLLKAAGEMDIDLENSWMIGDGERDIQAGKKAGCKTILIDAVPKENKLASSSVTADYRAINFQEAVNIIQKERELSAEKSPEEETAPDKPEEIARPKDQSPQGNNEKCQPSENQYMQVVEELDKIYNEIKKQGRYETFSEFSTIRLLAGLVQILAVFCVVLALWFLINPASGIGKAGISLLFSTVFQVMALTFYIMRNPNR
jgi:D,D-heptose 1,7-bisphosphate phosphatase